MAAQNNGFTVIELLMTIVIAGILLAIAIPQMSDFVAERRVSASVKEFIGANRLARSEAIKRGQRVTVCSSVNAESNQCARRLDWSDGWLTMTNDGGGQGGDILARQRGYRAYLSVAGKATSVRYEGTGRVIVDPGEKTEFVFAFQNKFPQKVCISLSGQTRLARKNGNDTQTCST